MSKINMEHRPNLTISANEQEGFKKLSKSEKQILRWIAAGKQYPEISIILGISERTATIHGLNAMKKLDVHSKNDLTRIWLSLGEFNSTQTFEHGDGI